MTTCKSRSPWQMALLLASLAAANMQYSFSTNGTCPGVGRPWSCDPHQQNLCGQETSRSQSYCCPPEYDFCGTGSSTCNGDDGKAGAGQIDCEANGASWCCSGLYETCTQRQNQINVCLYNKTENPYVGLDTSIASQIWSSVISSSPSAVFNEAQMTALIASATATSSSTSTPSTTTSPTSSVSTAQTSSASPTGASAVPVVSEHNGLSGGAIGGIVVGVVAAIVVAALLAFLLLRKRRNRPETAQNVSYHEAPQSNEYDPQVWSADRKVAPDSAESMHELESYQQRAELGNPQDTVHELPGR